jgi:ADP-heptose:LPS heptosyltransferase
MTLPAVALLKKHRPNAYLTMVTRPLTAPLLTNHPLIDEVIAHNYQAKGLDFWRSRALAKVLRAKNAGAAFHFDGQARGGVLSVWAGIPTRAVGLGLLGVSGLKLPWLYNRKIVLRPLGSSIWESLALSHQRLVAAVLGLDPEPDLLGPRLTIPKAAKTKALRLLAGLKGAGPVVGLTLRGRQKEKSWPLDFWAEVIRALKKEKKARFYVAGENGDLALAERLGVLAGESIANFCGQTDLVEFVALAGESDLYLTVDTGSAHLVSLTATPLVTVFTATNPVQWGALSQKQARICYNSALARFGLTEGPFEGYQVVRPGEMIKAALTFL